ncbi:MAG: D-tyrosyl-tRNA(Tyr) deacylase [Ruminococcaceae bacterium]|nr:D-tyrosyl-tRNA(Tyr) deacylase [Oscillospiraceae bacterium]
MKAVLQRVSYAACRVDGEITGECKNGLLVLLGVGKEDTEEDARLLAEKICKCRIFCDDNDKMNFSVCDIDGEMLVISNFTLLANYAHGNRPDYMNAKKPDEANKLYEYFCELVSQKVKRIGRGVFGAEMHIETQLMGPVTIVMDSEVLKMPKSQRK